MMSNEQSGESLLNYISAGTPAIYCKMFLAVTLSLLLSFLLILLAEIWFY